MITKSAFLYLLYLMQAETMIVACAFFNAVRLKKKNRNYLFSIKVFWIILAALAIQIGYITVEVVLLHKQPL